MFTGATPVPMFAIITPGPYTHSKQSNTFLLNVTSRKIVRKNGFDNQKWLYECYRHLCHVVDVSYKFLKDFHDYYLFNMSDQIVVGNGFSCSWLKNYKKTKFCATAWPVSSTLRRRVTQILKNGLNAQQWRMHHCKIPHKNMWKLTDQLCFHAFFGFVIPNHGVWVQASIQNDWNRSHNLKIKENEAISINFFYVVSNMHKTKRRDHVFYGFS